uniref:Putative secreted protein n=1 Tax=Anopheles marajoara TaxID=58244 RepID=A0A2M4C6N5_9DIPT
MVSLIGGSVSSSVLLLMLDDSLAISSCTRFVLMHGMVAASRCSFCVSSVLVELLSFSRLSTLFVPIKLKLSLNNVRKGPTNSTHKNHETRQTRPEPPQIEPDRPTVQTVQPILKRFFKKKTTNDDTHKNAQPEHKHSLIQKTDPRAESKTPEQTTNNKNVTKTLTAQQQTTSTKDHCTQTPPTNQTIVREGGVVDVERTVRFVRTLLYEPVRLQRVLGIGAGVFL